MVKDFTLIEIQFIDFAKSCSNIEIIIQDSAETPLQRKIVFRHINGNKKDLELCTYMSGDIKLNDNANKMNYHYNKEINSWEPENGDEWRLTADFIDQLCEVKTEPTSAVYENIKEWIRVLSSNIFQPPPLVQANGYNPNDKIVYITSFIRNNNVLSIEYEKDHSVYLKNNKYNERILVSEISGIPKNLEEFIKKSLS